MKNAVFGALLAVLVCAAGFYAGTVLTSRYAVVGLSNGVVVRVDTRTGSSHYAIPWVPTGDDAKRVGKYRNPMLIQPTTRWEQIEGG